MKRKVGLLALLTLALSACSLPTGSNTNNNTNNNNDDRTIEEKANDVAIQILNMVTLFPQVGDEVNFDDFVDFDAGFDHTLSEYTFTSSDNSVIEIVGYHATCKKQGYATVSIAGPGINRKTELSFYVGSIAGTYVADNRQIGDKVKFEIGEVNESRIGEFHLTIENFTFRKNNVPAFDDVGEYFKNGTPFLPFDFSKGSRPSSISPVSAYLQVLGFDTSMLSGLGVDDIIDSVYGYLSYDVVDNAPYFNVIFMGELIEFYRV